MLTSAIKGYSGILAKVEKGICARNRSGASSALKRRHKKLAGQNSWYKQKTRDEDEGEPETERVKPRKTDEKGTTRSEKEFST